MLERIRSISPERLSFTWNRENGSLLLRSGSHTVEARSGATHLLVDGKENLMDGQPVVNEDGILILEVNAVVNWIEGTKVQYDDRIHALRIDLISES